MYTYGMKKLRHCHPMYKYLYMYLYLYLYLYEADRGSKVTLQLADSTFSVVPPLP